MAVPPLLRCQGVRSPHAKAINGIYEYGDHCNKPCYKQVGVSSGNVLWFCDDTQEGPMWVITHKATNIDDEPSGVVARSSHRTRWPWQVDSWQVCGRKGVFVDAPSMCFSLVLPSPELIVQAPSMDGIPVTDLFRRAGFVNGKVAFKRAGDDADPEVPSLRIFFMPKMGRWLLASTKEGAGIETIIARSHVNDELNWVTLWPWEVEADSWESPTADTVGLDDADAEWQPNRDILVRLSSPGINIGAVENYDAPPAIICGYYEQRGMANGRVYYVMVPVDTSLSKTTGPMCLWYAEDRGQWVITAPELLGDSSAVLARIASRAWWPWEAHLGSTTSAACISAAPFATMPPWHGGAALLAGARVNWFVADENGGFREAKNMVVELDCAHELTVLAAETASHPFVGDYAMLGLIGSRPYFMQTQEAAEDAQGAEGSDAARYTMWYAEDTEAWVITEQFRLLDELVVDARCRDSSWFPWQVAMPWEVSNGDSDFVVDINVKVEEPLDAGKSPMAAHGGSATAAARMPVS
eukprot:TRINITY_DN8680_c0_g1_i1.p1 TRINITY_DN8680_c0_g1~~TRINITY_DN8680_c0_g1_i1.p1  ORF type:complete len:541 (+),score=80.10 TRINITY_DN8680_c0_g1_i1:51-1625(+)